MPLLPAVLLDDAELDDMPAVCILLIVRVERYVACHEHVTHRSVGLRCGVVPEQQAVAVELQGVAMVGAFALDVVIGGHRHAVAIKQAVHVAFKLLQVQPIE